MYWTRYGFVSTLEVQQFRAQERISMIWAEELTFLDLAVSQIAVKIGVHRSEYLNMPTLINPRQKNNVERS